MITMTPERTPKAAEHLRQRLQEMIVREGKRPGDRISSEGELIAQLGHSRATVREALRMLESDGVIILRQGSKGGVFVAEPKKNRLSPMLKTYLEFGHIAPKDLLEVRRELETGAARLAAVNHTDEDLTHLEESIDRLATLSNNSNAAAQENIRFHYLIVEAAHNPLLTMLVGALHQLMYAPTLAVTYDHARVVTAVQMHRRIHAAIKSGDPAQAQAALHKHLKGFEMFLQATNQMGQISTEGGEGVTETGVKP